MSHQAVYVGDGTLGVDLARAARQAAANARVPASLAEAAVMEAHGHAKRGDERDCSRSLADAERRFAEADRMTIHSGSDTSTRLTCRPR